MENYVECESSLPTQNNLQDVLKTTKKQGTQWSKCYDMSKKVGKRDYICVCACMCLLEYRLKQKMSLKGYIRN